MAVVQRRLECGDLVRFFLRSNSQRGLAFLTASGFKLEKAAGYFRGVFRRGQADVGRTEPALAALGEGRIFGEVPLDFFLLL